MVVMGSQRFCHFLYNLAENSILCFQYKFILQPVSRLGLGGFKKNLASHQRSVLFFCPKYEIQILLKLSKCCFFSIITVTSKFQGLHH